MTAFQGQIDDLRPSIRIVVNGHDLLEEVTSAVTNCVVDMGRGLADQIELSVLSPYKDEQGRGYSSGEWTFIDSKVFQPGNTIQIYLGYGDQVLYANAGIIQRWLPNFSKDGVPTLTIKALDASVKMMNGEFSQSARSYDEDANLSIDVIVRDVLKIYDIKPNIIDSFPALNTGVTKKQGMSDYQFVTGLANLTGVTFRVFYEPFSQQWQANFTKPVSTNKVKYHFEYGGENPTLLGFQPDWSIQDQPVDTKVLFFNKTTEQFEEVTVKTEKDKESTTTATSLLYTGGTDITAASESVKTEILKQAEVRIATGDTAIDVIADIQFQDTETALTFAQLWLRRKRDMFITGQGDTVGMPDLRTDDVHELKGIGVQLSGDWEFTRVKHTYNRDSGFMTSFNVNKVLAL